MRNKSEQLLYYWDLLKVMTEKELKVRYKNTFFGFLWIFMNPVLQMLVIGFVFRFFIKEPIDNYYLYLLIGLLIWNFFNITLLKVTPCIVNERSLIKKAKFPRIIIPLSIVLSNYINLLAAFALLIVPILYLNILSPTNLLGLFLGFSLLFIFTFSLGILTCSLNVRFRDINFIVQAVLIVWFYATPIVYSINVVPYKLMWLWRLNPLTSIVQLFQNGLISAPAPGPAMLTANLVVVLLVSLVGIKVFLKESKNFDDWL